MTMKYKYGSYYPSKQDRVCIVLKLKTKPLAFNSGSGRDAFNLAVERALIRALLTILIAQLQC